MNKSILELHDMLINNKTTSEELVNESIKKCRETQDKYNAFVTIIDNPNKIEVSDNILSGIPFGVKDNYSTKGILSTGSSNTLKDYVPFFNATAVENLFKNGAVMVGKTVLDEFGMGGTGTTGHTGIVKNPWDESRICGGSSAGSAAAVAAGCFPYALGSDTGDSIRKPAAFCGIVGYKPTYGMISRYGLFPFASSLDTCGVLTRSVEDAAIVVDAMKGIDDKDLTSWDSSNIHLYDNLNKKLNNKKVFYIKEIVNLDNYTNPSDEFKKHIDNFFKSVDILRNNGIEVEEVSIDKKLLEAVASVYVCLSCAEATSNMSNLTGISFGPRGDGDNINDMMKSHRTKGFSPLIKRRFVIGSYILQKENQEKYFVNAQRVRRLIVDKMNELFKEYDAWITPVGTGAAPLISDATNHMNNSEYTIIEEQLQIGNFGGYPSITIPNGFINNMPVGINITSKCYNDEEVLNIAYLLESNMNYKDQVAGGNHE